MQLISQHRLYLRQFRVALASIGHLLHKFDHVQHPIKGLDVRIDGAADRFQVVFADVDLVEIGDNGFHLRRYFGISCAGILLRFQRQQFAVAGGIEQAVVEQHRVKAVLEATLSFDADAKRRQRAFQPLEVQGFQDADQRLGALTNLPSLFIFRAFAEALDVEADQLQRFD